MLLPVAPVIHVTVGLFSTHRTTRVIEMSLELCLRDIRSAGVELEPMTSAVVAVATAVELYVDELILEHIFVSRVLDFLPVVEGEMTISCLRCYVSLAGRRRLRRLFTYII